MAAVPAARFENVNLLRAFAALSVLVYHVIVLTEWAGFPTEGPLLAFRVGWLGVDLFFVISGFVIAYSALALYRSAPGRFAPLYWSRRLTRIAPLYYLTLALWLVVFWPQYAGYDARDWLAQLASHLTFTHSFWTRTHGTIDGPNWSLAIEMQFYLAVALAIGWIDRTPGWRIWLYGILVAWAYRSGIFFAYGDRPGVVLFIKVTQLPGTLDEFGAGIFLAKWVIDRPAGGAREGFAWMALAAVLGWVTMALFWPRAGYWDHAGMVIFWRTALAAFLLCAVGSAVYLTQSIARRWLRPLDYLGELSYGIYLWHFFAINLAIAWVGKDPPRVLAITLAATLAAAALSWHAFEKPFMRLARR